MYKRNMSVFCQEAESNTSSAISPETLDAMPSDTRNSVPEGVGKNYTGHGTEWGQRVLKAEQGIMAAEQTLDQTKKDLLMELALLPDPTHRSQFIGGVDGAFRAVKDPLHKRHQNILADLRRVAALCDTNGEGPAIEKLKQPGGYQKIMESFPRRSNAGGSNQGQGAAAVTRQAAEIAKENPQVLADALKTAQASIQSGQSSTASPTPNAPRTSQQPEFTLKQVSDMILSAPAAYIEGMAAALAKRCQMSNEQNHRDLAEAVTGVLDKQAIKDSGAVQPAEGDLRQARAEAPSTM